MTEQANEDIVMFGEHVADKSEPWIGGVRHEIRFDNGYGASILNGGIFNMGDHSLYELGMLDQGETQLMDFAPEFMEDNPLQYLTIDELVSYLDKIKQMPQPAIAGVKAIEA